MSGSRAAGLDAPHDLVRHLPLASPRSVRTAAWASAQGVSSAHPRPGRPRLPRGSGASGTAPTPSRTRRVRAYNRYAAATEFPLDLDAYPVDAAVPDEAFLTDGVPHQHWRPLYDALREWTVDEVAGLQERTVRAFSDTVGDSIDPPSLDCLPHLLSHAEWRTLEAGLTQRAVALNLLNDIYATGRIARDGVIPADVVRATRTDLPLPPPRGPRIHARQTLRTSWCNGWTTAAPSSAPGPLRRSGMPAAPSCVPTPRRSCVPCLVDGRFEPVELRLRVFALQGARTRVIRPRSPMRNPFRIRAPRARWPRAG